MAAAAARERPRHARSDAAPRAAGAARSPATSSGTRRWGSRGRWRSCGGPDSTPRRSTSRSSPSPPRARRRRTSSSSRCPMHTALRLGVQAAERVRAANPRAHVCFHGLYAWLNAEALLDGAGGLDRRRRVRGGAGRSRARARRRGARRTACPASAPARHAPLRVRDAALLPRPRPHDAPAAGPLRGIPARRRLPTPPRTSRRAAAACTCAGTARWCRSTAGGSSWCRAETVLADIRAQVAAGARHVTFGDPDFLNGPGPRARRRPAPARGVAVADLRLHGQGRAPAEAPRGCCRSSPPSAARSWSPRSSR